MPAKPQPGAIKFSPRRHESGLQRADPVRTSGEIAPKIKEEKLDPKFMQLERPETPRENGPLKTVAPPRPPNQQKAGLMTVVEQSETPMQEVGQTP